MKPPGEKTVKKPEPEFTIKLFAVLYTGVYPTNHIEIASLHFSKEEAETAGCREVKARNVTDAPFVREVTMSHATALAIKQSTPDEPRPPK